MDLASVLEIAAVSGLFGAGITAVLIARFVSVAVSHFPAMADEYIEAKLAQLGENPEVLSRILRPVLGKVVKDFTGMEPGKPPKPINFMGIPIPAEVYMPFVHKFAGQLTAKGAESAVSLGKDVLTP